MKKKTKIVLMSVGGVLFVGAVIFLIWYVNDRQKQIALEDMQAANNCCFEWGNCGEDLAKWEAGWGACQRGECSSCPISGSSGDCDGDGKCEAGEDNKWCASDCKADGTDTGTETETPTTGGTWNQCNGTPTSQPTNRPCGSCTINSAGGGSVAFGCELKCAAGTCPATSAGFESAWFHCSGASGSSCTEKSADLMSKGTLSNMPSSIAAGEYNSFNYTANYIEPDPKCGRVQVDVRIAADGISVAGEMISYSVDCDGTGDYTPSVTPPSTTPSCTITSNAVCVDEDTISLQWSTVLKNTKFSSTNDYVRLRLNNTEDDGWYEEETDIRKDIKTLNGSKEYTVTTDIPYRVSANFYDAGTLLCESEVQTLECLATTSSCSESCTENSDCVNGLTCSNGMCRNSSCLDETDCICDAPPASCNLDCEEDDDCEDGLMCSSGMCRNEECTDDTDCVCDVDITPSGSVPQTGLFDTTKSRLTLGFVFIFVGISLVLLDQFGILQIRTDLKTEKVREKFEKKLK